MFNVLFYVTDPLPPVSAHFRPIFGRSAVLDLIPIDPRSILSILPLDLDLISRSYKPLKLTSCLELDSTLDPRSDLDLTSRSYKPLRYRSCLELDPTSRSDLDLTSRSGEKGEKSGPRACK